MGTKITRWALRQLPKLTGTAEKLVLMVLAVDADNDGLCSPDMSLTALSNLCGLARSTTNSALTKLRKAGILATDRQQREDGGNDHSVYRLARTPSTGIEPGVVRESNQGWYGNRTSPSTNPGTPSTGIEPPTTSGNADPSTGIEPATSLLPPTEVVAPRASATRARTRATREEPENDHDEPPPTERRKRLDDLNTTATRTETRHLIDGWRSAHTTQPTARLISQMTAEVDKAVRAGHDIDCLGAALREWNSRPDLFSPKVLAGLYDDAVSRRNAGQDTDRPLIDDHGFPRIDPQHIPDGYLSRAVVDRVLGPDSVSPPPYPPDADHPDGYSGEEATLRTKFFTEWRAERTSERRAEVRRILLRAWNRRSTGAA